MLELWPADVPVVIRADGLVLREWTLGDLASLVALYDTAEMDRRTPVASPFDEAAARQYVDAASRGRRDLGTLQLAITAGRDQPLGEVLAFPTDDVDTVELAYAVEAAFTGRGIASTAVRAVLDVAASTDLRRARLLIASGNLASERVGEATGFERTDKPFVERHRKGYVLRLATWERKLYPRGVDGVG